MFAGPADNCATINDTGTVSGSPIRLRVVLLKGCGGMCWAPLVSNPKQTHIPCALFKDVSAHTAMRIPHTNGQWPVNALKTGAFKASIHTTRGFTQAIHVYPGTHMHLLNTQFKLRPYRLHTHTGMQWIQVWIQDCLLGLQGHTDQPSKNAQLQSVG